MSAADSYDWPALAQAVRDRRRKLGIPTQEDAAHRAGMSQTTWQRVEAGIPVSPRSLSAVASLLGWEEGRPVAILSGASGEVVPVWRPTRGAPMPEIADQLARYLAARDSQRDDRVNHAVGAMSDRERALVREAAVMGYVQGAQGRGEPAAIPKDSAIVWRVIDACMALPDLYPVISALAESNEVPDA